MARTHCRPARHSRSRSVWARAARSPAERLAGKRRRLPDEAGTAGMTGPLAPCPRTPFTAVHKPAAVRAAPSLAMAPARTPAAQNVTGPGLRGPGRDPPGKRPFPLGKRKGPYTRYAQPRVEQPGDRAAGRLTSAPVSIFRMAATAI